MSDEHWKLNKSSSFPLHQQIYEDLKRKIMNGEWSVGTKVPSQRDLAKKFQVNRSTLIYAMDELTADGLIESKVGKGTMVVNNTWGLLSSISPPDWNSYANSGVYQSNIETIQEINRAEMNNEIIRLGTGELSPTLLPTEKMKSFIQNSTKKLSLSYSEPRGDLYLRKMISEYLKSKNIHASPASILIVSGGLQALQLISLGLLHRGSTIFLETPSYLNSVKVFQSAGMNLFGIRMNDEGILTNFISRLKRQHQGALLYSIPSYHNPTGILMSNSRRRDLINICKKERLPIIEDDVYGDLWFDNLPPDPIKVLDDQGLVLYLGSMSKTLGPGLRIGWIVGPEPVIHRLADIKMQTDYGSSTISQFVVAEWLASGLYEENIQKIRKELKIRRDFMIQILNKHFKQLTTWKIPKGGFYIWLHIKKQISMHKLFKKSLKEGVLLNPGYVYDQNDQNHLRLSYSYASLQQLEKGLIRLSELIEDASDNNE
ncbi:PLP-dependent aminotransferase family protein [Chengkuizengella sediminis]|uniref:aminotransferase-like domain-containing protein n=1 Tax=Chengkuizengella sediminis TaxID=1885917 RepID=UPI001389AD9E|nr:PLP-dependent aminotransferase family protein [Chengkuizengella sediminis]NDI34067.1 PLP-dependent aminotransferase family protein [Chengkuizengella sediminis]